MGVCCVKQHNQDLNEFQNIRKADENPDLYRSQEPDKIIESKQENEKSEAKFVKEEHEENQVVEKTMKPDKAEPTPEVTPEVASPEAANLQLNAISENSKARELEEKLGPFKPPEVLMKEL